MRRRCLLLTTACTVLVACEVGPLRPHIEVPPNISYPATTREVVVSDSVHPVRSLRGYVVDPSGAILPGALVEVLGTKNDSGNPETVIAATITNQDGWFAFYGDRCKTYRLRFRFEAFDTVIARYATCTSAEEIRAELRVGASAPPMI